MHLASTSAPSVAVLRLLIVWGRRDAVSAVVALLVAGFLLVTPMLTGPGYVTEQEASWGTPTSGGVLPLRFFFFVTGVCVVAGVLIARRHAVLATTLTLLPLVTIPWLQSFMWGWFLGTIAVAALAASGSWRRALTPYAAALGIAAYYCASNVPAVLPIGFVTAGSSPGSRHASLLLYFVAITAVVAVSASISASQRARQRQLAAASLERHAMRVEVVAGERAQIARDLHDVVAHHVSLVAVRAESAPYQHPTLDDDARAVLAEIAEYARQALDELRQILVVLQRVEDSSGDQPSRAPQPEVGDVDELVHSARAAGQRVEVRGAWSAVPPAQGYVLYRAVQEGLTNARRHAPRSAVALTRTQGGSTIGVTMTNSAHDISVAAPGRGIIGMGERIASLGGTMSASVVDDRFELRITLPLDLDAEVHDVLVGA